MREMECRFHVTVPEIYFFYNFLWKYDLKKIMMNKISKFTYFVSDFAASQSYEQLAHWKVLAMNIWIANMDK